MKCLNCEKEISEVRYYHHYLICKCNSCHSFWILKFKDFSIVEEDRKQVLDDQPKRVLHALKLSEENN